MKSLFFLLIVSVLFAGCTKPDDVTEEECKQQGKIFKVKKVLNFRTGEFEKRTFCE